MNFAVGIPRGFFPSVINLIMFTSWLVSVGVTISPSAEVASVTFATSDINSLFPIQWENFHKQRFWESSPIPGSKVKKCGLIKCFEVGTYLCSRLFRLSSFEQLLNTTGIQGIQGIQDTGYRIQELTTSAADIIGFDLRWLLHCGQNDWTILNKELSPIEGPETWYRSSIARQIAP